jgi:hypothetical protein
MKTNAAVYNKIKNEGLIGQNQLRVYDLLYKHGYMTGAELSRTYRKLYPSSSTSECVRNRLSELCKMQCVAEVGVKEDPETKNVVALFGVTGSLPVIYDKRSKKQIQRDFAIDLIFDLKKQLMVEDKQWSELIKLVKAI